MTENEREQTEEFRETQGYPAEYATSQEYLGDKSAAELEEEIEHIRQDMDHTISAIERKLSPNEIIDRSLQYFQRGPGEYIENLGNSIKNQPLPAALVGIGLSWLMISSGSRTSEGAASSRRSGEMRQRMDEAKQRLREARLRLREEKTSRMNEARQKMQEVRGKVEDTAGRTKESLGGVSQSVSDRMQRMSEKARQTRRSAREWSHRVGEAGHRSRERVQQARSNFSQAVETQPLLLGVLGIAAGILFGAMLPRTRREDAVLGPAKESLKEQAVETGREQVEKGRQIAAAAAETAREEAERQLH